MALIFQNVPQLTQIALLGVAYEMLVKIMPFNKPFYILSLVIEHLKVVSKLDH